MRLSLLSIASFLVIAPACASSGRTTAHDAHVSGDTGHGTDAGTVHDTGTDAHVAPPDMGPLPVDMGTPPPDMNLTIPDDMGTVVRPDAFVGPDTGTPAPDTGCSGDLACSNGIACDGMERCVSGACLPATAPMNCDDGLACTADSCAEPGTCNHTSTCGAGQMCTAGGCVSGCSESPCRVLTPQCGCAAGQACYPTGATRMCAAVGTGTSGTLCTNNSSCSAGNVCLNVSTGTPVNVCTRMCATDSDCGGGFCEYSLDDGTGMAVPGFRLCSHPCNAATGAGCATGSVCTIFQETTGAMRNYTDCFAPTTGAGEDVQCTTSDECSPNRFCIDTNDGSGLGARCHHWCNTANNAGCTAGHVCLGFMTPIVVSGITYGVCSL